MGGDVVELAGSDGSEAWRVTLAAAMSSVAVDSAGDVVATEAPAASGRCP